MEFVTIGLFGLALSAGIVVQTWLFWKEVPRCPVCKHRAVEETGEAPREGRAIFEGGHEQRVVDRSYRCRKCATELLCRDGGPLVPRAQWDPEPEVLPAARVRVRDDA